jgi:hypothetical protein
MTRKRPLSAPEAPISLAVRSRGKAGSMSAAMRRLACVAFVLGLALLIPATVYGQQKVSTYAPPLVRPAGATGTVVVPDRFLRRWDPVTVFFVRDVGPAKGGPEDHPERLVTTSPTHPGAFTWIDARSWRASHGPWRERPPAWRR